MYPQPALGSFNVKAELNGVKSGSIEMFDLTGRKVLQQNFVAPGNTLQLKVQTENLPAGTYVLTVKDGSEIVGAKPITVQQ